MRIRWFGEPWPSEDERAPVCDDDDYRIDAPAGVRCASECGEWITAGDRGIACAYGGGENEALTFGVEDGDRLVRACAYHIDCWIAAIVPEARHLIERRP